MNLFKKVLLPLMAAIAIQGCSSDTTNPPETPSGPAHAKKGSTYTFHHQHKDSTGAITLTDTNVYRIGEDNLVIDGRTGVRLVLETSEGVTDTMGYIYYGEDSIASFHFPFTEIEAGHFSDAWLTLPESPDSNADLIVIDTTVDYMGSQVNYKVELTTTFMEHGTITVSGKSYIAHELKLASITSITFAGQTPTVTNNETLLWWVPEVGFIGRREEMTLDHQGRNVNSVESLVDFTLIR